MSEAQATLMLRIDTDEPIELDSFVGAFTSLAEEYRREMNRQFPDVDSDARIFVKEVRKGSYIAELIPYLAPIAPFVAVMDQALIVENFVRVWGKRIRSLATGALDGWAPTKSELDTFADAVKAIANDRDGKSTLEAATFEDEERRVRVAFSFSTKEAKACQETIDSLYRKEEKFDDAHYERVLMVFTRTDVGEATVGIRSAERVVIKRISEKNRSIMYSSKLAEERNKI